MTVPEPEFLPGPRTPMDQENVYTCTWCFSLVEAPHVALHKEFHLAHYQWMESVKTSFDGVDGAFDKVTEALRAHGKVLRELDLRIVDEVCSNEDCCHPRRLHRSKWVDGPCLAAECDCVGFEMTD